MKDQPTARYHVRSLDSHDFPALQQLEADIFGHDGEPLLCPYYLRLCTEFYADSCFLATVNGRAAGYLLSFVRDREAYCTTLAVRPEFQRTRLTVHLLARFVQLIVDRVDTCWFTVKADNHAARGLHAMLGACDAGVVHDFYGPGDQRLVARIDRAGLDANRARYERLGLLPRPPRLVGAGRQEAA